jgi:predicted kinase
MTKAKVISFIKRDIAKLAKERNIATPKHKYTCENETLRNYLAARQHTLKEILSLLT